MSQKFSSSPVLRSQVFTLEDGAVVVQWGEQWAQDIHTGAYREYSHKEVERRLMDYELTHLKEIGVIEHYNNAYIWLYPLPEKGRFIGLRTQEKSFNQQRYFYLNTTLPSDKIEEVRQALADGGLLEIGAEAYERDGVVAITGERGMLFLTLEEAEAANAHILTYTPPLLAATTIAFADTPSFISEDSPVDEFDPIELDDLIADQDASSSEDE